MSELSRRWSPPQEARGLFSKSKDSENKTSGAVVLRRRLVYSFLGLKPRVNEKTASLCTPGLRFGLDRPPLPRSPSRLVSSTEGWGSKTQETNRGWSRKWSMDELTPCRRLTIGLKAGLRWVNYVHGREPGRFVFLGEPSATPQGYTRPVGRKKTLESTVGFSRRLRTAL